MTNISHLLTALVLTAAGAALLLPLAAHPDIHHASATITRAAATPTSRTGSFAPQQSAVTTIAPTTTEPTHAPITPPTTVVAPTPVAALTPTPPARPAPVVDVATAVPAGYGCAAALGYLQAHAAPGFIFECPGWADGHQAMTCDNVAGICPGAKVIAITTPCPAAYMNEASNSWVVLGESDAAIDPYGYCR